jgi:hypothetical protein
MVIVKLQGGLGNQLFQYAAARSLAARLRTEVKADLSFLLDRSIPNIVFRDYDLSIFPGITLPRATEDEVNSLKQPLGSGIVGKILSRLIKPNRYCREKGFKYNRRIETLSDPVYLNGYWQSEKYFLRDEALIRQNFAFGPLITPGAAELMKHIQQENAVCINVRRGDFVSHAQSSEMLGFVGMDYYEQAIGLFNSRFPDCHYFIFSDDIDWCRDNIQTGRPTTVVSHQYAGPKFADYLQLMTACRHFLIPNSTFAWWAAWLSKGTDKLVIAPKTWFTDKRFDSSDIVPGSWLRL